MARIEGLSGKRAGRLAKLLYVAARRKLGQVPEPLRIAARSPALLVGLGAFETALGGAKQVEPRLKVLASLKVSTLVGCPW